MLKGHQVPLLDVYHEDSFTDMLMLYARDIENAFLLSGAVYGQDYNLKLLFELAQPFVLALNEKQILELSRR